MERKDEKDMLVWLNVMSASLLLLCLVLSVICAMNLCQNGAYFLLMCQKNSRMKNLNHDESIGRLSFRVFEICYQTKFVDHLANWLYDASFS